MNVDGESADTAGDRETDAVTDTVTGASLPEELSQIPAEYFREADQQGTLTEVEYDTYESMSYEEQDQILHKRTIVYLPYGYGESQRYPVFYALQRKPDVGRGLYGFNSQRLLSCME